MERDGSKIRIQTSRSVVSLDPMSAIRRLTVDVLRRLMSRHRLIDDPMQSVLYRRERIEKSFERLDDYVLGRDHMEPGHDVRSCAEELVNMETRIFNEFNRVNRDSPEQARPLASQAIVPTLLYLLEGVIKRHGMAVYNPGDGQLLLPSSDLYGAIIRHNDPRHPFILRTLREIPPESVRPEYMQKKIAIQRMLQDLTSPVGTQDAASIYLEMLARLWSGA